MKSYNRISISFQTTLVWFSLTFVILFAAGLFLAAPAQAAGLVGNGTPASCTEAALTTALAGGGTVSFNCGASATILVLSEKIINQNTVIQGGGTITLTGGLATRLFRVNAPASLTLNNLTLDSAFSPTADGGAILSTGPLTLNNVTIQNSKAGPAFCGGAIRSDGLTIITDSRFIKNSAGVGGGAICTAAAGAPTLRITGSTFNSNQATLQAPDAGVGGAIYLKQTATLAITGSTFLLNKADGGGALALEPGATATVRSAPGQTAVFLANSATINGGAIYSVGTLRVYEAQFNGNAAPENLSGIGYGGAVASMGTLTLRDSLFSANRGRFGGGLFVGGSLDNARADIRGAAFSQNVAGVFGGGLYTNNDTTVITVTNSIFQRNTAATGGGLGRFDAHLYLANSSLTENTALNLGGGMYLGAGSVSSNYVLVRSVTISSNQAGNGVGGGITIEGQAELYYTTLVNNSGGIYITLEGNTRFRGSVVHNPGFPNCTSISNAQISNDAGNHISDDSCGVQFTSKGDPKLGPLQNDGLYTASYHLPLAGSPLINLGPGTCPERDQRGALRVGICDIGAVEYDGPLPPDTPINLPPFVHPLYLPLILR